jgi:hypothetical protein
MIAKRYMLPGKGEAFIALVAGISLAAVMLGVAALVIVMSVMNGFRAELFDKIVGLNGHAIIQAYGGRLDNWQSVLEDVRKTPGVTRASPLIEQPLLATFNGRVEAILVRGNTAQDIARIRPQVKAGSLASLRPGGDMVAIGSRLAQNLGVQGVPRHGQHESGGQMLFVGDEHGHSALGQSPQGGGRDQLPGAIEHNNGGLIIGNRRGLALDRAPDEAANLLIQPPRGAKEEHAMPCHREAIPRRAW